MLVGACTSFAPGFMPGFISEFMAFSRRRTQKSRSLVQEPRIVRRGAKHVFVAFFGFGF